MKLLIVITLLTASLWSSFSYATNTKIQNFAVRQGQSWPSGFTIEQQHLVTPCESWDTGCIRVFIAENLVVTRSDGSIVSEWNTALSLENYFKCSPSNSGYDCRITSTSSSSTAEESQTCRSVEGGFLEARHNSPEPFCAHVGSTGGENPEPLLCMTREVAEVPAGSGSHIHEVTATSCSAVTGPTSPDGDGDDDGGCTENCNDDGGDDGGGDSGSGDIPSTGNESNLVQVNMGGTFTDSAGNVTNVNLTMDNDFSPITVRQNETNQRLAAIQDQLHSGQQQTNHRLDGVISAIGGIGSGGGSDVDTSGIESRLDAINDRFNDSGQSIDIDDYLPPYEAHLEMMHNQVSGAMVSEAFQGNVNQLENLMDGMEQSFTSFPQLWQFYNSNCTPLTLGQRVLDICPYAQTSSQVSTWIVTMLTIIFLIVSSVSFFQNLRLS